eukprot:3075603-Prymnesium_polylepis.1
MAAAQAAESQRRHSRRQRCESRGGTGRGFREGRTATGSPGWEGSGGGCVPAVRCLRGGNGNGQLSSP